MTPPTASPESVRRTVAAVWRTESRRVVAAIAAHVGDFGLAEDLAQEAVAEALENWPETGVPRNPGAWLTAVAKRRAIDAWRRDRGLDERYRAMAHDLDEAFEAEWEPLEDDELRLVFTACHPVLAREARVALTLRVVGGLTSEAIARMFLVPVPTMQARITRAKKTLSAARVPFETPDAAELPARLTAVLDVLYLVFTEGYAATAGDELVRRDLAEEALRLARIVAGLLPREPEAHGLVALMELQASRFGARTNRAGDAVPLDEQDRSRWDRAQIQRGIAALDRCDALGRGRGPYALQAAIAREHAVARTFDETRWDRIVVLYGALAQLTKNPVVEVNRAVAVAHDSGPEAALRILDRLASNRVLAGSHLLPSVRGELLTRLDRAEEAAAELERAVELAGNGPQRRLLEAKLLALRP